MGQAPLPIFRTKPLGRFIRESEGHKGFKRVLNGFDLMALGVGAIIGTGIFVLTGVAALAAGPAVMLSFVFAGLTCIFAALCYSEFAARIPIAGSAYTYAYASMGEIVAWIIGWDLILEYTIGAAAVARGWSGYVGKVFGAFNIDLPGWLMAAQFGPLELNLLAGVVIVAMTALLTIGIKESSQFNMVVVAMKVFVVLFVILAGASFINPGNWTPFMPYGFNGVLTGAGMIFFAYIGFDAVSTAAEEVKNPQRDLPIGIIGSLAICMILYIAVSAVITGMIPFQNIDETAPLATAFEQHNLVWAQTLISVGALAGLTTVVMVLLLSQPRIYFSMSRDGLFFPWFSKIHEKFGTPFNATVTTGLIALVLATFFDLESLAEMVNIGTLFAFVIVCCSTLVLRYRKEGEPYKIAGAVIALVLAIFLVAIPAVNGWVPVLSENGLPTVQILLLLFPVMGVSVWLARQPAANVPKTFKCPWVPLVPILGITGCLFMMLGLPGETWTRLWIWLALGLAIYFFYGFHHSKLAKTSNSVD